MLSKHKHLRNNLPVIILMIAILLLAASAFALQTVNMVEGQSTFVDVSQKDLNLIKFPSAGVKPYTASKIINVTVDGSNVFVEFPENSVPSPQELFFVTASGTYSLILVPKGIPAETIIARIPKEDANDAIEWERSHDYISGLKELVKAMYLGVPPMGFTIKNVRQDITNWENTRQTVVAIWSGAMVTGEVREFVNLSDKPIRLDDQSFYSDGTLATSIDPHDVFPGQKAAIYLVKKSQDEKRLEHMPHSIDPLKKNPTKS